MLSRWQVIDEEGTRDVIVNTEGGQLWSHPEQGGTGEQLRGDDQHWPAFTQLALRAPIADVREALLDVTAELELPCSEITSDSKQWHGGIFLAEWNGLTLVGEPGVDIDERFLGASTAEMLAAEVGAEGVYFGHDPSLGSLYLTVFAVDGKPEFAWCDSLEPGPSFVLAFNDDGSCSHEDPRAFAHRKLDLPKSQEVFDRREFVRGELQSFGLERLFPDFVDLPVASVFRLGAESWVRPDNL